MNAAHRTVAKRFLAYLANLLETIAEYDDGNKNVTFRLGITARFLNHSSEKGKKRGEKNDGKENLGIDMEGRKEVYH